VGTMDVAGQDTPYGFSSGLYVRHAAAATPVNILPAQEEIDDLWARLTADGGAPGRGGWLKDKFGLSWQIVPNALGGLLSSGDPARSKRVMQALFVMEKLDVNRLQQAFDSVVAS